MRFYSRYVVGRSLSAGDEVDDVNELWSSGVCAVGKMWFHYDARTVQLSRSALVYAETNLWYPT